MRWQDLFTECFEQVNTVAEQATDGLTPADLNTQPHPDCNSIGWLIWHLSRVQDRAIAALSGTAQLWIAKGWYREFGREPSETDTGFQHTIDDLANFKSPDRQVLLQYHHEVLDRTREYLSTLTEEDLDRKIDHPMFPTLGARLAGFLSDNLQHAGQAAYSRGLLQGKGWFKI